MHHLPECPVAQHRSSEVVCIVDMASRGYQIAVQLAKEGVKRFILADKKRLTRGEVSMHACSEADVGCLSGETGNHNSSR